MNTFNDETFLKLQKQMGVDSFSKEDFDKIKSTADGMSFAELKSNLDDAMKNFNIPKPEPLKSPMDPENEDTHPFQKFMKEQTRILGELEKLKKSGVDIDNLRGELDKVQSEVNEIQQSEKFKKTFEGIPPPPSVETQNFQGNGSGGPDINIIDDNESKTG